MIELLPRLVEACPSVRLVWVGDDIGGRRPQLMAQVRALGVAERVKIAGQVAQHELYSLLAEAHLYASVASFEAFGISTIEAMASGTVPVVTSVGIHPEAVESGVSGLLLDGGDLDADAAALAQALRLHPDTLAAMGEAAREAAHRYAWHKVVQQYLDVYTQATERAAILGATA